MATINTYDKVLREFNLLLDEIGRLSDEVWSLDKSATQQTLSELEERVSRTAVEYFDLPEEESIKRNLPAKYERVCADFKNLQQIFQLKAQKVSPPAADTTVEAAESSEVGSRRSIMEFFEVKLPRHNQGTHPKYEIVRSQFEQIGRIFHSGRPVRGRNDCTFLSFGLGYLKHISDKKGKVQDLLMCALEHSKDGSLARSLGQYMERPYDLESLAGDSGVMKDLVLVLRREVAEYVRDSYTPDAEGNWKVKEGRLNPCHQELFVNPRVLQEFEAAGIEIPAGQLGGESFEETCQQIREPGKRAAGALEYDALSRRFECPFVDLVFRSGRELINVGKGKELNIRAYPLIREGTIVPLDALARIADNGTFAILAKDTGHSEVLFR